MGGEVIKSFLVGLGFDVDESSLSKFMKALADSSVKVLGLYAAVNAMAAGIFSTVAKVSEDFEQMGYEMRLIAPAINKALVLRNELLKAYANAGVNIQQAVVQAVKFNMSLEKTKFALKAIYTSVAAKFFPLLTKQMDMFRKNIYANMPKIQAALEKFTIFVFKAFEAVTRLGGRLWSILTRVYDFFVKLHDETGGWSTAVLAIIAAWRLLNLAFLATPLGMILTGLTALLALFDDFRTYQEGGQALIDWDKLMPGMMAFANGITSVMSVLEGVEQVVFGVAKAFYDIAHGDFSQFLYTIKTLLMDIIDLFYKVIGFKNGLQGFHNFNNAVGEKISGLFKGNDNANVGENVQGNPVGAQGAGAQPLGTNNNGANNNVNVHQQTQINVNSTADANAVGKAVAGQQNNVNYNMTRNMKSPTK